MPAVAFDALAGTAHVAGMHRLLLVVAVSVLTQRAAHAANPSEPGTLERGDVSLGAGVGFGDRLYGFGALGTVGLGRVDLTASVSGVPRICLGGLGCDAGDLLAGGGIAVRLARTPRWNLGARLHGQVAWTEERIRIATASLVASTGSEQLRFSIAPTLVGYEEGADDPFGNNGLYLGASAGVQVLGDVVGVEGSIGLAAPITGQDSLMPLLSLTVFSRS